MPERKKPQSQLDFLRRITKPPEETMVEQWWYESADLTFVELAQNYVSFRDSRNAVQAHLDVTDEASLDTGVTDLLEGLGDTFLSARAKGISADQIARQVYKRAKDLERRSEVKGWSTAITHVSISILAQKWGVSERKVEELKRNISLFTQP